METFSITIASVDVLMEQIKAMMIRLLASFARYPRRILLLLISVVLVGCQGPPKDSFSPPGSDTAGRKIYVAKCARCHKLYNPAKYSDSDWEMWMTKMVKKAKLNPNQQQQLAHYIDSELRHPEGTNAPASP